jgi:Fe-S cluster assembly scaffold protein SufB
MKLTVEDIKNISSIKEEPYWMLDFRLNSYECFVNSLEPNFGPKLDIDYDNAQKELNKRSKK